MALGWIRIDRGIGNDPKLTAMAFTLKKDGALIVGHVVLLLAEVAQHAKDGNIAQIPDMELERWARWSGKRGVFAQMFRSTFAPSGVITSWYKYNGAAIEKAEADAERLRLQRAAKARRELDALRDASRDASGGGSATRQAAVVGTNDDERTDVTNGESSPSPREPVVDFVLAANRGLAEHVDPAKRIIIGRIKPQQETAVAATKEMLASDVPRSEMTNLIYETARTCRHDGTVNSLGYIVTKALAQYGKEAAPARPRRSGAINPQIASDIAKLRA